MCKDKQRKIIVLEFHLFNGETELVLLFHCIHLHTFYAINCMQD